MAFIPPTPLLFKRPHSIRRSTRPFYPRPPPTTIRPPHRTILALDPLSARPLNPPLKDQQPLQTGYGQSTHPDLSTAVQQSIIAALSTVPTPAVALITSSVTRDQHQLYSIAESLLPGVAIHGATTCAAPLTINGSLPSGVSVLILGGAGVIAAGASGEDGYEVGKRAADLLAERMGGAERVKHVIMQASPGIEEQVLGGVASVLGEAVEVFGGSAADDTVEGGWSILSSDVGVFSSGVALVGVGETVRYGASLCVPYDEGVVGEVVTKAQGRVVYELGGRKAAKVLGEWVGESIAGQVKTGGGVIVECARFPLGVWRGGGWVALHAAEIGEDGSVGFFAEVREGERVVCMERFGRGDSVAAATMGLERAYEEAMAKGGLGEPTAGLMIYCGGLSIAVGDGLDRSLESMKDKVPLLGMTVFGEQGRVGTRNSHSNLAVGVALFE
eukprot:GFKZ01007077.1.p1 GENE.GFKZ01007077.1~~GFKZ01007077.1.p1  ORF type:complete len:444 (-),score=67.91 GFKZ01007077.1:1142-2473(-)